jgi:hypothetical protein
MTLSPAQAVMAHRDRLAPLRRGRAVVVRLVDRTRRRRGNPTVPTVAVVIVGAQRSGTTMLLDAFGRLPSVEIYGESDPRAFESFRIRGPEVIRGIVRASRGRAVVFKPLCDSHRTASLLEELGADMPPPLAVWVYRSPDDRIRSSVARFGDNNLRVLRRIAEEGDLTSWQAGGLSDDRIALIRSFDYDRLGAESAAGLFWYIRNSLYFDGLDARPDVTLCSYDAFVASPEPSMQVLCRFLGLEYDSASVRRVRASPSRPALVLDERVRALCDEMLNRLDNARRIHAGATH